MDTENPDSLENMMVANLPLEISLSLKKGGRGDFLPATEDQIPLYPPLPKGALVRQMIGINWPKISSKELQSTATAVPQVI